MEQVSKLETAKILELAEQALSEPGDFVELGCYKGDTSILLGRLLAKQPAYCSAEHEDLARAARSVSEGHVGGLLGRSLHIYDSFEGLPEKSAEDISGEGANFRGGELAVSKREVVDKLKRAGLKNVRVKKAWFSDLTDSDLPEQIAFAFIDGDFYESQKQGLALVRNKMSPQGIIICHDYNNPELPGASRAVDEFLRANSGYRLAQFHTLAILTK